jgi:hypothetical protein
MRILSDSHAPASEAKTVKMYGGEESNCAFAYENPIPLRKMMGWKKAKE